MEQKELRKHPRSMRLDPEVNRKLEAICKALGTNANSYILNELGKAIIRDYQSINIQNNSDETFKNLALMMASVNETVDKPKLGTQE